MEAYNEFYAKYSHLADIFILYILEAHFVEKNEAGEFIGGWPIGYQYNYEQTKSFEDRRKMVELLIDEYHPKIPIVIDTMSNDFQNKYNPWPDRAYMFLNGKVTYISAVNDDGTRNCFWTDEISRLLDNI